MRASLLEVLRPFAGEKHMPYFAVLEAMRSGHCPLCHLGARTAMAYMNELLSEGINDPGLRRRTRESRGLCRDHAWYLRHHGGVPGMFLVYRDVLEDASATLQPAAADGHSRGGWRAIAAGLARRPLPRVAEMAARLRPRRPCPVCEQQAKMERLYAGVFLAYLLDDDIQACLGAGTGLCLDHLCLAMELARDRAMLERLLADHGAIYGNLLAELDDLIAHLDYSRRLPGRPRSADAGIRALRLVAGEEGIT